MNQPLPPLSPEAAASPYAKYYYKPLPAPFLDPAAIAEPMDPENAVMSDLDRLLAPEESGAQNGYCLPKQGGGYVAITTQVPGVTVEMYRWWKHWRETGDDLRYQIWYPGSHMRYASNYEVGWEWIQEDIGNGLDDIYILPVEPEEIFDMDRFRASGIQFFHAGNGISRPVNGDPAMRPFPMFVAHMIYGIEGGIEIRSRFWQGYHCKNRRLIPYLPEGVHAPAQAIHNLALHCLTEYANLREIIPPLYREYAGQE